MPASKNKVVVGKLAKLPEKKRGKHSSRMAGAEKHRAAIKKANNLYNRKIISAAKKLQANMAVHISAVVLLTPSEYKCIVELVLACVDKVRRCGCGGLFSYRSMQYRLGVNVLGQVVIYFYGQFKPFIFTDFGTIF